MSYAYYETPRLTLLGDRFKMLGAGYARINLMHHPNWRYNTVEDYNKRIAAGKIAEFKYNYPQVAKYFKEYVYRA